MKKLITSAVTMGLILSMGSLTAFATDSYQGASYIDSDNDGVCDNVGVYRNFIDEDGDGICDILNSGMGQRKGANGFNFIDEDGDGINDNIGSGNGGYFADSDGDGECDNIGTRQGMNSNQGRGRNR